MRRYSIYRIEAPDGRAYIGATVTAVEARFEGHVSAALGCYAHNYNPHSLGRAMQVYGPERFSIEHLASATTPDDAAAVEEALIAQHGTMAPHGYNLRARSAIKGKGRRVKPARVLRDWIIINPKVKVAWPPHPGASA